MNRRRFENLAFGGMGSLGLALMLLLVALPAARVEAVDEVETSIESLLRRNPRGREIVEEMARNGLDDAMIVLCQAGDLPAPSPGASSERGAAERRESLFWCSRGAALGHPAGLRELGLRLLSEGQGQEVREGLSVLVLAELVGDPVASLEVALLPDFFDVTTKDVERARRESLERVEQGRFHDASTLGLRFEFSDQDRAAMRQRQRTFLQRTTALEPRGSGLERQLGARRDRAEGGELVSSSTREAHRRQLEAKDALQRRLSFELKRASREDVVLSEHEQQAREDRRERLRLGAELHTDRIDPESRERIEFEVERLLGKINHHRAKRAPLALSDVGLPWRVDESSQGASSLAAERFEGVE